MNIYEKFTSKGPQSSSVPKVAHFQYFSMDNINQSKYFCGRSVLDKLLFCRKVNGSVDATLSHNKQNYFFKSVALIFCNKRNSIFIFIYFFKSSQFDAWLLWNSQSGFTNARLKKLHKRNEHLVLALVDRLWYNRYIF